MDPGHRVLDLLHELDTYRDRYHGVEVPEQIASMNVAISRRARRIEVIRRQMTELIDEMEGLEGEIEGIQKGYEALLADTLDRIRRHHDEGWSPSPVRGYRLWEWRDGGLHGAWEQWRSVGKQARCRHEGDLPHSNGRCGRLGCGVYATKALDPLLTPRITTGVPGCGIGVVEMTGKVVEHDHGYRAAQAEVIHLILVGPDGLCSVYHSEMLDQAFADPDRVYSTAPHVRCETNLTDQIQALFDRRSPTWTSEHRSA